MGTRHDSRRFALQFLYQQEAAIRYPQPVPDAIDLFWKMHEDEKAAKAAKPFATALIEGVMKHSEAIDAKIKAYAQNWDFHRIALVDLSILRVAIYELLFCDDIPPVVSINEAIELAKQFSTEDSGRFVNGVLDRIKLDLSRPLRSPVEDSKP